MDDQREDGSKPLFCTFEVGAGAEQSAEHGSGGNADGLAPADLSRQLGELTALTRELVAVSREQLRLVQRAEERHQKQQQAQREEFQRWLGEHSHLVGRCGEAHEVIRNLLGRALTELVEYVEDNGENLLESEFVRTDLIDRYGSLLNHVSAMHSVLKRLAAAEEVGNREMSR